MVDVYFGPIRNILGPEYILYSYMDSLGRLGPPVMDVANRRLAWLHEVLQYAAVLWTELCYLWLAVLVLLLNFPVVSDAWQVLPPRLANGLPLPFLCELIT